MTETKVIVMTSQKGGTGKTTTAINLAVAAWLDGKRVLVVDLAAEANASLWYDLRENKEIVVQPTHPAGLARLLFESQNQGVDWCIIDTEGGTNPGAALAVRAAHYVLITCKPSVFDRQATLTTLGLCAMNQKKPHVIVTHVEPGSRAVLAEEVRRYLGDQSQWPEHLRLNNVDIDIMDCGIGRRAPYVDSPNEGKGVMEYDPHGKATEEIRTLYQRISRQLEKQDPPRTSNRNKRSPRK